MKIIKPRAIIFDWNGTLVYNNDENKVLLLPNVVKVLKKIYVDADICFLDITYSNFYDYMTDLLIQLD